MEEKTVIITGASEGIGRATAVGFAKRGANVVINYAHNDEKAKETLRLVNEAGGKGAIVKADVSKEESAELIIGFCIKTFGAPDVLVNNAGITDFFPFSDLDSATQEVWDKLFRTNLQGSFFCARAASKAMQEKGGVIINLISQSGIRYVGSCLPYAVSKAAIYHMSQCLAKTLAPKIRVNCVAPGLVKGTAWNANRPGFSEEARTEKVAPTIPLKHVADPEDIARAICFLASDEAAYCTGSMLLVDGGNCLL
jgi:3-oxoacyl-[acyl-carrier protein] reductase